MESIATEYKENPKSMESFKDEMQMNNLQYKKFQYFLKRLISKNYSFTFLKVVLLLLLF